MSPADLPDGPGVDLSVDLAGLSLPHPVLTASGCGGTGHEAGSLLDPAALAGFTTRSLRLDPVAGAAMPRVLETPSGVLSATGLQGPGLQGFLATELPGLAQRGVRTVVSVAGTTLAEYAELARRLGTSPGVHALEVNLDTADAEHGGRVFAHHPHLTGKVLSVVRRDTPRGIPVLAKLSPDVTSLVDVARAAVDAGADGLVLGQPPRGLAIDPATLRPALGAGVGALSGPAVLPLALRCVWEVHAALPDVPLVGVGGVRTGFDALAMVLAGATAVQVGTATLQSPAAPGRIVAELRAELARRSLTRLADLVGRSHLTEQEQS